MNVLTWGSTVAERASHFPCDDVAFAHDRVLFRAITVEASPALAFRWLAQLRVAPYSYDLLDNFARRSPPLLTPGLDALAPGQRFMTVFRLLRYEPGVSLTIGLDSAIGARAMGDMLGSYRVDRAPLGARIVAKVLMRDPRGPYGQALRTVSPALDCVMFRKQLITLKRYVERDAAAMRYRTGLGNGSS